MKNVSSIVLICIIMFGCNNTKSNLKTFKHDFDINKWNLKYEVRLKKIDNNLYYQLFLMNIGDTLIENTKDLSRIKSFDPDQIIFTLDFETEEGFNFDKINFYGGRSSYISKYDSTYKNKIQKIYYEGSRSISIESFKEIHDVKLSGWTYD